MIAFTDCKINIGLDILSKRADGYHDISTVMVPVPWHDVIEILPTTETDTTIEVIGIPIACKPEDNIVMKAYRLLQSQYQLPPVRIILQKNIPDGAGLGGGSGDAATTLLMLNDIFSLGISKAELSRLAVGIGADCPFFIYDEPMLCEGIGEILTPVNVNLSGVTLVIAKPGGVSISTKQAYAGTHPQIPEKSLGQLIKLPISQWKGQIKNDFEASIFPIAPQIEAVKQQMYAAGAIYAAMSGSGASVFGLFDEKPDLTLNNCITFTCQMP